MTFITYDLLWLSYTKKRNVYHIISIWGNVSFVRGLDHRIPSLVDDSKCTDTRSTPQVDDT